MRKECRNIISMKSNYSQNAQEFSERETEWTGNCCERLELSLLGERTHNNYLENKCFAN